MIDNFNPTNQFHPYVRVDDTPAVDKPKRALDWQSARDFAKRNPAMAFGALAALAIGAALIRGRR